MFSCHLPTFVGRIFFHCFGISCFLCIVLPFADISLIFFFRLYFLVYFLKLYCYFFLCCLFVSTCFSVFPLFYHFGLFFLDFFLRFLANFPSWFSCFRCAFSGDTIFSQTNFAPSSISSFNSVILFVDLLLSISFILFVSFLTVLYSMFLSDSKVVVSPFVILFTFSNFTFCFCVSVCSGLFGWVLYVVFLFSKVGGSFRLDCFCLLILCVSDIVLFCPLSIFWCISSI